MNLRQGSEILSGVTEVLWSLIEAVGYGIQWAIGAIFVLTLVVVVVMKATTILIRPAWSKINHAAMRLFSATHFRAQR